MKVTSLTASKKHPERINIFLDGQFALQVHIDSIYTFGVKKGSILSDDILEKLRNTKRIQYVKQLALAFVGYKPRTEFQVRQRLQQKECDEEEITIAINFLYEFNYLNDKKYAEMYISDRSLRKSVSREKLRTDLRKKGVDSEIINDVLNSQIGNENQYESAYNAAQKKLSSLQYKPLKKQQSSLCQFLLRQRFEYAIIKNVLNDIFGEQSSVAQNEISED